MSETNGNSGQTSEPIALGTLSGQTIKGIDSETRNLTLENGSVLALPEGYDFAHLKEGEAFELGLPQPAPTPPDPLTAEAIKLPDGTKIDEGIMGKFVELANEHKLSPETAQGLVDLQIEAMNAISEQGNQQWNELQDTWSTEAKADPVIGGDKLDPALGQIAKLIDTFSVNEKGEPDKAQADKLREVFDLTGAGNNPTVMRFLSTIAQKLVVEGGPISGTGGTGERTQAQILYPNQGKG